MAEVQRYKTRTEALIQELNSNKEYDAEAEFQKLVENRKNSKKKRDVVLDLDETLFNTVKFWVEVWNNILEHRFGVAKADLPTAEQVYAAGGTDNVYKKYYVEAGIAAKYDIDAEGLRLASMNNFIPEKMEEDIHTHLTEVFGTESDTEAIGSITARPGEADVIRATRLQFKKHGVSSQELPLDKMPIVGRPKEIPVSKTTPWKIENLEELEALRPDNLLIIADDSLSLANGLKSKNQERLAVGKRPIIQIVYKLGPNTLPKIQSGEFVEDPDHGIYISDWKDMASTMKRIEAKWETTQK